jgi:hypothetical protein
MKYVPFKQTSASIRRYLSQVFSYKHTHFSLDVENRSYPGDILMMSYPPGNYFLTFSEKHIAKVCY